MLEFIDETLPNYDQILKLCGQYIQQFNRALDELCPPSEPLSTAKKPAEKRKKENNEPAIFEDEVKEAIREGTLGKYKVGELATFLKIGKGTSKSKKKADLLDALKELYEGK